MESNHTPAFVQPSPTKPRSRVESAFLLSMYVTLGMACVCLTYSELALMRQIIFFSAFSGGVLVLSYLLEGKWSLSTWAANLVGGLIAAFAGIWIAMQMQRPDGGLLVTLPFPTILLPYLGPLMMILLVAKLLRPKTMADHWGLQFIGLVCVALSCALADDATFGVLLLLYFVSGLWSLALFFVYRQVTAAKAENVNAAVPKFRRTSVWAFAVFGGALVLFFYTPRSESQWQLSGSPQRQTTVGLSEDPTIDLNSTGPLELSSEVVFEVQAKNENGSAKRDLPGDQRWRGPAFQIYFDGKWLNRTANAIQVGPGVVVIRSSAAPDNRPATALPDLGRGQFYLEYTLRTKIGPTPYVAQPIIIPPSGQMPVIHVGRRSRAAWQFRPDGTLSPGPVLDPQQDKFRQVLLPYADPDVSPAVQIYRQNLQDLTQISESVRGLESWTLAVAQRLADRGQLSEQCLNDRFLGSIKPQYYEPIARALEEFLANSGEYRYSLDRERSDMRIDPILDFLMNTRAGHCNRFASALVLMLRSLSIPCQVVLGYRGADSRGDGRYDVKQCHAHAWVEALVPIYKRQPDHGLRSGEQTWHWLTLDPTPSQEALAASSSASNRWWTSSRWSSDNLFRSLILNFSPANRDQAGQQLLEAFEKTWINFRDQLLADTPGGMRMRTGLVLSLASMLLTGALIVQLIRFRRWRKDFAQWRKDVAFHRRMLAILARHGWLPSSNQTSREFVAGISPSLQKAAKGDALSGIVTNISNLYYRVRFGSAPLSSAENATVRAELDFLASQLAAATR